MVFAWLERDVEVGAEEGGAQFGHELLHIFEFFDVLEDVVANRSGLLWGGREGFQGGLGSTHRVHSVGFNAFGVPATGGRAWREIGHGELGVSRSSAASTTFRKICKPVRCGRLAPATAIHCKPQQQRCRECGFPV
jgi:hypothetical protein